MRCWLLGVILFLSACSEVAVSRDAGFDQTATRVLGVAQQMCRAQRPDASCAFVVQIDDRPGQPPNAFQSLDRQGRPVLTLTTAMIARTRNADELAFVIAHEAAHHIAGHLGQQLRRADGGPVALAILAQVLDEARRGPVDPAAFGLRAVTDAGQRHRFEREADIIGARIASAAGYDALLAAQIFRRLPEPVAQGDYPANAERIGFVTRALRTMP